MNDRGLAQLSSAVKYLLAQDDFTTVLGDLKTQLAASDETFVWATVDLGSIPVSLPDEIKSCWIFHLRCGVPSGSHRHPNSVQHMATIQGTANADIGGVVVPTVAFASEVVARERWLIIETDMCHEFTPLEGDMTVVSFHTAGVDELEEVSCDSGESRLYEPV